MAKGKSNKPTIIVALILGGVIAIVGYRELNKDSLNEVKFNWVREKLQKRHRVDSVELLEILHSNYNLETYAKTPALVDLQKDYRDSLNNDDRSALKHLIDKVTTQ